MSHMHRVLVSGLAVFCCASGISAQAVPARDLWEFPLGAMYEPSALASEPGAGLWNPAMAALRRHERFRFGVASLSAGSAQGVDGQLLTASRRLESGTTIGLSAARVAISGLVRTETDPQTVGDIPYATWLVSVTGAREVIPHLTLGTSLRWRYGRADQTAGEALAADLGAVLHDLPWRDARVALSSFLWRPGREIEDRPALTSAGDIRLAGSGEEHQLRGGVTYAHVNRGARESGPFISARGDRLEMRLAWLGTRVGGETVTRMRSGLSLHYSRFVVAIAREEGASGLGAIYQFTLSSIVR